MQNLRSIFPFMTTTKIPENIQDCLSDYAFRELTDSLHESKGFDFLMPDARHVHTNSLWLFKYVENKRKANPQAVERLHRQWLQKATDDGHDIPSDAIEALREQAVQEVLRMAPISALAVYIIYDEQNGRVWCGGNTNGHCQRALKHLRSAIGSLKTTPLIYDRAGRQLVRQLAQGMDYREGFPECLLIPENGKLTAASPDQNVTFDGVDLRDRGVSEVLEGMAVRSVEMYLQRPDEKNKPEVVATFTLHVPESGAVFIKGLDYDGADAGSDGDTAHDYATAMLIVSGFAWDIFDAMRVYFHGSSGAPRTATGG
jgi:hypothetical protein